MPQAKHPFFMRYSIHINQSNNQSFLQSANLCVNQSINNSFIHSFFLHIHLSVCHFLIRFFLDIHQSIISDGRTCRKKYEPCLFLLFKPWQNPQKLREFISNPYHPWRPPSLYSIFYSRRQQLFLFFFKKGDSPPFFVLTGSIPKTVLKINIY